MFQNPESFVQLALQHLGMPSMPVRVQVDNMPVGGLYSPWERQTIHVASHMLHSPMLANVVFEETKHMVDCMRYGFSDEVNAPRWADELCNRLGYPSRPQIPPNAIPFMPQQGMPMMWPQMMSFMPPPPVFMMQPPFGMPQCRGGFCVPRR